MAQIQARGATQPIQTQIHSLFLAQYRLKGGTNGHVGNQIVKFGPSCAFSGVHQVLYSKIKTTLLGAKICLISHLGPRLGAH